MVRTNELEQQLNSIEAILNRTDGTGAGSGSVWVAFPISLNPCPSRIQVQEWLAVCDVNPRELVVVVGSHGKRLALVTDHESPQAPFPDGWGLVQGQGRCEDKEAWVHPKFLEHYRAWLDARVNQAFS